MKSDIFRHYAGLEVPRYTSYPTAPNFSPAIGEASYREWLGSLDVTSNVSLYLHVPFCRSMCWYCGCHTTVTARPAPVSRYLTALAREIELVAGALPGRTGVRHLHFGGGTPTQMAPEAFESLMVTLRAHFHVRDEAEVAIEIDPRTLEAEMVRALAAGGVNRASIGVQTFDPAVQRAINRVQSFETTASAVESLRRSGIEQVNFDLIYGLPGQTVASCLDTVEKAVSLNPDRLAVFGYAHVPSFKRHQRKIEEAMLPGRSARLAQSRVIAEGLTAAGYEAIGLDHFARPADNLAIAARAGTLHRNFQGYTADDCPTLIGLGSSSIGRLPQGYVQNAVLISQYQDRVSAGRLPTSRGYALSQDDRLRAEIIERLMCDQAVDLDPICAPFGVDPHRVLDSARLAPLLADGLIVRDGCRIEVARQARILVRAVAAAFDAYLPNGTPKHSRAV